ncbi:MAG: protease modulator HflC [Alphaproteobacteria bacterium]|nr:protease modulator HflC [Alphaproteobacteria bacterium]
MSRAAIAATALVFVLIILAMGSLFIVDQTEQAIVLQLGEYKRTIRNPGLQVKIPLFQNVVYFDRRVLDVEPPTEEVIASDQKRLVVDSYARFRVTDPLQFYQSVGNELGARSRLDSIISASLRRVLGNVTLASVLSAERAGIMRQLTDEVKDQAKPFGIEVLDVRLRRTDLPEENNQAIYARMQSERQREAQEFRAQGDEFAQRIKSVAERERTVILAEAQRQAQILRGEGDGESVKIYADAFGKDKDFFSFYRSMQAYREALGGNNTTLVLTPDSEFFRFFDKTGAAGASPAQAPAAGTSAKP